MIFPAGALGRRLPNIWDIAAILAVFGMLVGVAHVAGETFMKISAPQAVTVSLDPANLPVYALRTTMRMFAALAASLIFTFTFGTAAAKSKRASLILIPLLDILQSVPILGFLSFTVVFFMNLFPGRVLGLEFAAIFAIFTSQAWNMAFSMYQSLRTVPADLQEAARSFHLTAWQRFWRLEVPFAVPGLVWNTMMSMSGGWFFVVASEAVSVGDHTWKLPGIGSYVALALDRRDIAAVGWAILAMGVVILLYDQLLFRPLVAWSARFRFETTAGASVEDPWVLRLFRRTRALSLLLDAFGAALRAAGGLPLSFKPTRALPRPPSRLIDIVLLGIMLAVLSFAAQKIVSFLSGQITWGQLGHVVVLGCYTLIRVVVLIAIASADLGADRRLARPAPGLGQTRSADRPVPCGLPGKSFVSAIRDGDRAFPPRPGYLADAADDPGHPVVHPVQCHRRRRGLSGRPARSRRELPPEWLAMVAEGDDPGDLPLLRNRRDHRLGRVMERCHRRRGCFLGRHETDGARPRRLYRRGHDRGAIGRVVLGVAVMSAVRADASTGCCGARSTAMRAQRLTLG